MLGGQRGERGRQHGLVDRDARRDVDLVDERARLLDHALDRVAGPADRERLIEHRVDIGPTSELGVGQRGRAGRRVDGQRAGADRGECRLELVSGLFAGKTGDVHPTDRDA